MKKYNDALSALIESLSLTDDNLLHEKYAGIVLGDEIFVNPSSKELAGIKTPHGTYNGIVNLESGDLYIWMGNKAMHDNVTIQLNLPLSKILTVYIMTSQNHVQMSPSSWVDPNDIAQYTEDLKSNRHLKRILKPNFTVYLSSDIL